MNRRRKKLIRLDLQLKIVFITLFVASLVLLINFQLSLASLWSLSEQFVQNAGVDVLLENVRKSTIQKFLISVGMAIPLAASVGILYSFKFSGPIFRFKKYFSDLRDGRWDERCMLRRNDDLQDVCEVINRGVDALRVQLRQNHALLSDVKRFLEQLPEPESDEQRVALDGLKSKIDSEDVTFRSRFGLGSEVDGNHSEDALHTGTPSATGATLDAAATSTTTAKGTNDEKASAQDSDVRAVESEVERQV